MAKKVTIVYVEKGRPELKDREYSSYKRAALDLEVGEEVTVAVADKCGDMWILMGYGPIERPSEDEYISPRHLAHDY